MKLGIASGDRVSVNRSPDGLPHWGGAGWVRLGQYIPLLEAQGIEVHVGTLVWNRDHFSIDISEGNQVFVDVDIIYLQRMMHAGLDARIKKARADGQIVLNDLDDWYWGLSPQNQAFDASHPKTSPRENTNHYKSVLSTSDVVTVSTPYIAERIAAFVRCPIEVFPNTVDVARFNTLEHSDSNTPIVGWVGSTNHRSSDLEVLSGIIKPMYERREIQLQHSGAHKNAPTVASKWGLSDTSVLTVPASDPENYPSILTMDVGVAPLSDTPFNHAKSDIKLLEYSSAGIPWVASDLPSYSNLAKDWGVGRVAKKNRADNWVKHLKALRDPEVRATEGKLLRDAVWQRDIHLGATRLAEFLKSLLP